MASALTQGNNTTNKCWCDWFKSRESAKLIDQSNQERLFSTFNSTVSTNDCIEAVLSHNETVFLSKASFGVGKVSVFHHLTAVGGTIYNTNSKTYGFIQGLGKSTAISMTPDIDVLFRIPGNAVPTPTTTQVLAVSTEAEIDALTNSATVTYRPRNFIPIPPFLVDIVQNSISNSNGNSKYVLIDCVKAIKDFDTLHTNDEDFVDKARSKCKDIMLWLYLVGDNNPAIEAVQTMGCQNEQVAETLEAIKLSCLSQKQETSSTISDQVEKSLKRPFEVLASSASSTSDFMEKLTNLQNQSSEKSSKSFKKIPAKYQNMILVASSVGEVTVVDYDADAVDFFKCSTNLNAQVMINSMFETEGVECSISAAVTTTLLYGSFLWKNSLSPSGLAASVISSEGIFRSDTLYEGMILDYATRFDMSEASLSKLTKTQVVFPKDVEELTHRLKALHLLASFFFKKSGYMSQGLKKLLNFCASNRTLIKTRIHLDSKFIAKLICAVDERIYIWLKQCSIESSVEDTDVSLMNFAQLTQDIQLNRFNYLLPPCVTSANQKDKDPTLKKKKFEAEKNTSITREWKLRPCESWEAIFQNKTNDGPTLSLGCKPCLKYQVKGICYNDCKHKDSHKILQGEDKAKTDKYIKELRGV
jgi:hypothetical protein